MNRFNYQTKSLFYFDLEDYDKIKDYCWYEHVNKDGYRSLQTNMRVNGNKNRTTVKMHWLFVDKHYDHKDRNPLNNRRNNLRLATFQENARNHNKQKNNSSGVTGVYWSKSNQVWRATIVINKKKIYLGSSVDKERQLKLDCRQRLNISKNLHHNGIYLKNIILDLLKSTLDNTKLICYTITNKTKE